jgi:hypothetical protein
VALIGPPASCPELLAKTNTRRCASSALGSTPANPEPVVAMGIEEGVVFLVSTAAMLLDDPTWPFGSLSCAPVQDGDGARASPQRRSAQHQEPRTRSGAAAPSARGLGPLELLRSRFPPACPGPVAGTPALAPRSRRTGSAPSCSPRRGTCVRREFAKRRLHAAKRASRPARRAK